MIQFYLFLKWLHILAVISWMAGILYFYRLFIYDFQFGQANPAIHSMLNLMESRLYRWITCPAMMVAIVSGMMIVGLQPLLMYQRWFQVKFCFGVGMVGVTLWGNQLFQRFACQQWSGYTRKRLAILNEVPTVLMMIIVYLVIFRPF